MEYGENLISLLYSNELFRRIMNNQAVTIHEFNLATNFLAYNNIPYDISFSGATRKLAAAIELTIHINPSRTEVLVISLSPGSNIYAPSP